MRRERRDPYIVLGVGRLASPSEIARAYRRAARATHPDSRAGGTGSGERFRAVSDAYETLRDPQRRAAYDRAHPAVGGSDPAEAHVGLRAVRYGSPDRRHIVLGAASDVAPGVEAGRVEVVPPAAAVADLVFRLLRCGR